MLKINKGIVKDIIKKEPVTINSLLELIRQIDLEIIEVMKATKAYKWNPYEDSRAILKVNIHENVCKHSAVPLFRG